MSAETTIDAWKRLAACRGPQADLFFPPTTFERKREKLEREQRAKMICVSCPVRQDCLDFALRVGEGHGIWGGLNENERRALVG